MKICKCGYETEKTSFQFCPLCGKQLIVLELEDDGTYKAKREACRVFNGWLNPNAIYYYKISNKKNEKTGSKYYSHFSCFCHNIHPLIYSFSLNKHMCRL